MIPATGEVAAPRPENASRVRIILAAAVSLVLYGGLAALGDLREHVGAMLIAHAALALLMLYAWHLARRNGGALQLALGAALLFRLVAGLGGPALSDDVYRYVWDGRVQLAGHHPYAHAPADDALASLRDADWAKINHPDLETIYPPLAQLWFLLLAALGAGPIGFKMAAGFVDFGVVLALSHLLGRAGLPRGRLVLYAWNPLAVLETAGSGHIEPLGALLVLLAALWIIGRRLRLSTVALAAAVHVKLIPAVWIPGFARRVGWRNAVLLGVLLVGLAMPYAVTGPAIGGGTFDYAQRWERNAFLFSGLRATLERIDIGPKLKVVVAWAQERLGEGRIDWDLLYRHVWPREVAKLLLVLGLAAYLLWLARRRDLGPPEEAFRVLGAAVLIAPTFHPWYVLWVLPFAVAFRSWPWLLFGALLPLSYLAGSGEVPVPLRLAQYVPPILLMLALVAQARTATAHVVPE